MYPENTMDVNKGQSIKPGICVMVARRNALILFMELKNLSAVAVLTGIVKRTVRMKGMFGYNSASKTSSGVVNVLGGFCYPDQRAFQPLQSMSNASPLMSGSIRGYIKIRVDHREGRVFISFNCQVTIIMRSKKSEKKSVWALAHGPLW